jgi:hypothetical protein
VQLITACTGASHKVQLVSLFQVASRRALATFKEVSVKLSFDPRGSTPASIALSAAGFAFCAPASEALVITTDEWLDRDVATLTFDHRVHVAEDEGSLRSLFVQGSDQPLAVSALQIAQRYQRLWPRFGAHRERLLPILRMHRNCHDLRMPLVRADYEHALDVWQWTLRLAPDASLALQVAALFHDIERLDSEATARIEQHAQDYLAFKRGHARRGAHRVATLLQGCLADEADHVASLVSRHEQPEDDLELRILNDADALSFFSLNSAGYLAYFGEAQTEKKIRYTLARLSSVRARSWLETMRLEPFVQRAIAHA